MELGDRALDFGSQPKPERLDLVRFNPTRTILTRLGMYQIIFDNDKHILDPLAGTKILDAIRNSRIYAIESGEDVWLKFNGCLFQIDLNKSVEELYVQYVTWCELGGR